ncbi:MAG: hypothetical protein SV966_15285 [Actinomycetota bacterium]|nr:hypothetical protein [Actinomycetota bacterium]
MCPQPGAPPGALLANGLFLVLILLWLGHSTVNPDMDGAFPAWGWRVPFLLSP